MTDAEVSETATGPVTEPVQEDATKLDPLDEVKFTQRDMDKAVQTRLKEDRERRAREDKKRADEAAEAARIAKLEGEDRIKAEYEAKLKDLSERYETTQRELAISRATAKLAESGLPAELAANVIGSDDDETDRNIASLSKAVNDLVARKVGEGLKHGTPSVGGAAPATDPLAAELDRYMNIKRG